MDILRMRMMMMQVGSEGIDYFEGYRANGTAYNITSKWNETDNNIVTLSHSRVGLVGASTAGISFCNTASTIRGSTASAYIAVPSSYGAFSWLDANKQYKITFTLKNINLLSFLEEDAEKYIYFFINSYTAIQKTSSSIKFNQLQIGAEFVINVNGSDYNMDKLSTIGIFTNSPNPLWNIDFEVKMEIF